MSQSGPHQAYEYLREAIVSARSREELNSLEQLAQAHFDGRRFRSLEADIAATREVLERAIHANKRKPGPTTRDARTDSAPEKMEEP